jgi:beta-glucuronidase
MRIFFTFYKLISALLLVLISSPAPSQDLFVTQTVAETPCAPLLSHIDGRQTKSLNGTWNAMIDPAVFSLNDILHYAERNYKPLQGELVEVSLENGLSLQVPGDWNTQDDRLFFYNGKVWYKRDIFIDIKPEKRYYLHFGAINYRAEIYVNGSLVATHTGGYTSFNCEVTDVVKQGQNLLVIKVDNTLKSDDIPTTRTDWLNYGGITRDVNLVELPVSFIENYKIQLAKGSKDKIKGWLKVNGKSTGTARIKIEELGIERTLDVQDGILDFNLEARPELWSPNNPKLYEVSLEYENDVVRDHIGFRTIEVNGRNLTLNGEPIFLRGISLHEEAIGAKGRASSYVEALELLGYAKELNCNYVRLAHYTHNHHMLRAADELGLMVWAEIPVYWNLEFSNPAVMEKAKSRMNEMIGRDQNRASIIFWSLGNETPKSEARTIFFTKLNQYVKYLDDTRLTTAALVFGGEEIQDMAKMYFFPSIQGKVFESWDIEIKDPLASIVDVPAVNQYFGWYYSGFLASAAKLDAYKSRKVMLDNMHNIKFHIPNNKPFVFSELGAGAKRGLSGREEDFEIFSEEYQVLAYHKQIGLIKNQEGLVGVTPWILKDFRSPMRLYQGIQDYWNLKGLITDNGERKKAFFVLQAFYKTLVND